MRPPGDNSMCTIFVPDLKTHRGRAVVERPYQLISIPAVSQDIYMDR